MKDIFRLLIVFVIIVALGIVIGSVFPTGDTLSHIPEHILLLSAITLSITGLYVVFPIIARLLELDLELLRVFAEHHTNRQAILNAILVILATIGYALFVGLVLVKPLDKIPEIQNTQIVYIALMFSVFGGITFGKILHKATR